MTVPPPRTRTPAPFPFPTWPRHAFLHCAHTVLCLFYLSITFVLGFIHKEGDTIYCLKVKVWYCLHLTRLIAIKTFTLKAQWPVRAIGSIFMPRILGLAFRLPGTAWFHTFDDISNLVVWSFVIPLPTEAPSHQTCHPLLGFDFIPTKYNDKNHHINSHLDILLLLVSPIPPFSLHR